MRALRQQQQIRPEQRSFPAGLAREEGEQAQPAAGEIQPVDATAPNLESWYYARREGVLQGVGDTASTWRICRTSVASPGKSGLPTEIDGYHGYPCSDGTALCPRTR